MKTFKQFKSYIKDSEKPKYAFNAHGSHANQKIDVDNSHISESFEMLIESKIDVNGTVHKFIVDPTYDDHETSLHNIATDKIEKSFSKNKDYYISKGGGGAAIGNRYNRFKEFLQSNPKQVHASSIHINDSGEVQFNNGRHRYAVLRDSGVKHIPVSLGAESRKNAVKFGYIKSEEY